MKWLNTDPPAVELTEWETTELGNIELSSVDERTIARFNEDGRRIRIDWLHDGRLRVATTSWIGVVCLEGLTIKVVPKLVGGDDGVLRMLSYAAGLRSLRPLPAPSALSVGAHHLLDLVVKLLTIEARRLVETGLLHDYVQRQETIGTLRGRLRPLDQARREFGRVDRLACTFDDYETDILDNRIVAAGLRAGLRLAEDREIRRRVAGLASLFNDMCEVDGHDVIHEASALDYQRRNEHYRPAHTWALLLLQGIAIRDLYEQRQPTRHAFLLDMNRLFEQFVTRLLDDLLEQSDIRVHRQRRDSSIIFDEMASHSYGSVIPDLVLERNPAGASAQVLPIDVKYKRYDTRRIDRADIYQTFLYAFAFRSSSPPHPVAIVYPKETTGEGFRLVVRDVHKAPGVRLVGVAIDVVAALDAIDRGTLQHDIPTPITALLNMA